MPDHENIYLREAAQYHELIAKQPSLLDIIETIRPVSGLDIVDMGAGTGRISAVLAPKAHSIIALDASEAMLRITADRLARGGVANWSVQTADHRKLPLADQSADLIVSGWSICYLTSTDVTDWESNLNEIMREIKRVLRPDGTLIIFETLGTGHESPCAPDFLQPYYAKLVDTYGFSHRWIRTDYQFNDAQQAERLARFFFGDELADKVAGNHSAWIPECAGVWWLHPKTNHA